VFGTGFFQTLYAEDTSSALMFCTSIEYHVLITLPLLVLSAPFHFLWPLALTSLFVSIGVCVAAAMQANLPKSKRSFWSRPLVVLLFFLQPAVRGWARYQGRLLLPPVPRESLDRLAGRGSARVKGASQQLYYWSDRSMNRIEFLNMILGKLDADGWPSKADTGWGNYDVEIYGNQWSNLQLTTATEEFPGGKRLFRCRLRASWSLLATIAFGAAFGFELLIIGLVASEQPLLWLLLLTMPIFWWFLRHERRAVLGIMTAFIDELAGKCGMAKLFFDPKEGKFSTPEP
jgi:hypothetical protein